MTLPAGPSPDPADPLARHPPAPRHLPIRHHPAAKPANPTGRSARHATTPARTAATKTQAPADSAPMLAPMGSGSGGRLSTGMTQERVEVAVQPGTEVTVSGPQAASAFDEVAISIRTAPNHTRHRCPSRKGGLEGRPTLYRQFSNRRLAGKTTRTQFKAPPGSGRRLPAAFARSSASASRIRSPRKPLTWKGKIQERTP